VPIALHCYLLRCPPQSNSEAARELAKSFLKLVSLPANVPKTSLDELKNVENYLNQEIFLLFGSGFELHSIPERLKDDKVSWYLIRAPSAKRTTIMRIGIYGEHAFLIKSIEKLARLFECKH